MRLLVDTDSFCIFAAAGILEAVAGMLLGGSLMDCQRLPALPHMLVRGSLRKKLGDALADQLKPVAIQLPAVGEPPSKWLDRLSGISGIDPGEAQLLALAAEDEVLLLTGDKRALRALKAAPDIVEAVAKKVVVPEAALLGLHTSLGEDGLRRALVPAVPLDKMLQVCFSKGNSSPSQSLASYLRSHDRELAPLLLWHPEGWSGSA